MPRTIIVKPGYSATARRMEVPANFYALAEEYLDAAVVLYEAMPAGPTGTVMKVWTGLPSPTPPKGTRARLPMFFCLAQSAELFIQSFILANGVERYPGSTGHDLERHLAKALELGLVIDEQAGTLIIDIGRQNKDYQFRFQRKIAPIVLPPTRDAIASIRRLRDNILANVRPFMKVRSV